MGMDKLDYIVVNFYTILLVFTIQESFIELVAPLENNFQCSGLR